MMHIDHESRTYVSRVNHVNQPSIDTICKTSLHTLCTYTTLLNTPVLKHLYGTYSALARNEMRLTRNETCLERNETRLKRNENYVSRDGGNLCLSGAVHVCLINY